MRVLHVTDTYLPRRGGIELHVHDLAAVQRRAGHEVDVLTVTRDSATAAGSIDGQVIRPDASANVFEKARFIELNRRMGERNGYDVVHAHCSTMSPLVYATIGAAGEVPTAITAHSLWRRYTPFYRLADHVFGWSKWPIAWSAVSTAAAESLQRAARTELPVDVVPNGIDLSQWVKHRRTADPKHLRIVSVMRLAPRKRPLPLLRILRDVRAGLPGDVRLSAVIVGDGPRMNASRAFAARHDMTSWLTFTGHLPRTQINAHLAQADVYVAPARLESFGIAALEAAATGLPVVGLAGTGLSEFVDHGVSGLLLPDDAAISAALVDMGRTGSRLQPVTDRQLSDLTWPKVLERTEQLYERAGATVRRPAQTAARAS